MHADRPDQDNSLHSFAQAPNKSAIMPYSTAAYMCSSSHKGRNYKRWNKSASRPLRATKTAHTRLRVGRVSNHSQAHCSWVAVMVAFCRLFFISFFCLISYSGPDSQTTLYTEFESIDWLLIANWIRKECACLGWEAGALKLHWLHTNESDGWRLFGGSVLRYICPDASVKWCI